MSEVAVRPFRRADRDQLTALVNAHAQAVVPGVVVPVNAVLSQLERDPGEFIVDPWVTGRVTLAAEQRGRVVAAAHLRRYGTGEQVGEAYRDAAEIAWLLHWPRAAYWPDSHEAAEALLTACLTQLGRWQARRWYADGALPAPGVYGVPEQWPHVRALYEGAGFRPEGPTEVVLLAAVDEVRPTEPPIRGLAVRRTVGVNGTRLAAHLGEEPVGYIEVDTNLSDAGRLAHLAAWADVGNLHVADGFRRRGVGTWLVGQAAGWLRLARVERLLDYAAAEDTGSLAFLRRVGFQELTRTVRGWAREPA